MEVGIQNQMAPLFLEREILLYKATSLTKTFINQKGQARWGDTYLKSHSGNPELR